MRQLLTRTAGEGAPRRDALGRANTCFSAARSRDGERLDLLGQTFLISNLDLIRGIALLGILGMNAVSFGLPWAAYWNLSAAGSETGLDFAIGIFGEIFLDQKMMGLFSLTIELVLLTCWWKRSTLPVPLIRPWI